MKTENRTRQEGLIKIDVTKPVDEKGIVARDEGREEYSTAML
jgi:hypothetical protein